MDDLIDEVISAIVELKDYYYQNSKDTLKGMGITLPDEFDVLIGKLRQHSVFFRSTVLRLSIDAFKVFIVVSDNTVVYYFISDEGISKFTSLQELCYVNSFSIGMDIFIKEQLESFYSVVLYPSKEGDTYDVSGGTLIKGNNASVSNTAVSLPIRSTNVVNVKPKPKPKMEDRKYSKDELRNMLANHMSSDVSLSDNSFRDDGDVDVESTRFTRREDIKLPLSNELSSMFNKPSVNIGNTNNANSFNEGSVSTINYNKDYTGRNWD